MLSLSPLFCRFKLLRFFSWESFFQNSKIEIFLDSKITHNTENCWKIRCNFLLVGGFFFLTILVGELPQFFHMLSRWFITKIWRVYHDAAKYEKHFSRLLRKEGLNFSFSHMLWNCKKWSWKLIFAAFALYCCHGSKNWGKKLLINWMSVRSNTCKCTLQERRALLIHLNIYQSQAPTFGYAAAVKTYGMGLIYFVCKHRSTWAPYYHP